ncbi:MAG: fibronectin type III domain-containing protein [Calditrichaeota bacterium]|jgi:hypothetical protein|nr:fibronectin type III domain-containing protein [Calditrichota bacterium]
MYSHRNAPRAYLLAISLVFLVSFVGCSTANLTAPSEQPPGQIEEDKYTKSDPNEISMVEQSERTEWMIVPAPTNLYARLIISTPGNLNSVSTLVWHDNSENESGFRIERKLGLNGPWNIIGDVEAGVVYFTDNDLAPDRTYCYRVHAYSDGITSSYSNQALVVTGNLIDGLRQNS